MTEVKFKNLKPNIDKLLHFGFENVDNKFIYCVDLVKGQMKLTVKVFVDGKLHTEIIDNNSGDEYVLHRVASASGSFVGQVKTEYEAILDEIVAKCFYPEIFKNEQTKAVISHVKDTYGDELEFLWQKFPDNAVVRRKDNQKWYAAILTVSRRKLGFDSDDMVEILDLRIDPEKMESTVDNIRYFPGYHMNKKHWITICLDNTVSLDEIFQRINDSYHLARK